MGLTIYACLYAWHEAAARFRDRLVAYPAAVGGIMDRLPGQLVTACLVGQGIGPVLFFALSGKIKDVGHVQVSGIRNQGSTARF
jgi:hypothetical protein